MTIARRSVLTGGAASVGLVVAGSVPSLAEASPGNGLHQQPDKSAATSMDVAAEAHAVARAPGSRE